ncbi:MAG: hypothetical protein HFE84_07240 [Lachnospiraceae bacterium]|nr:hypothetical protein [Lachnospiraceae bacterium]
MTTLERLEKLEQLKKLINGPEAEEFKNYWDGRFFTGDMTFVFDEIPYNLYFYKGTLIDVEFGKPANGYYVGIRGDEEQWQEFFKKRNFQLAISVKHNKRPFEQLGSALANRQNNTVIAQVMRLLAKAFCE